MLAMGPHDQWLSAQNFWRDGSDEKIVARPEFKPDPVHTAMSSERLQRSRNSVACRKPRQLSDGQQQRVALARSQRWMRRSFHFIRRRIKPILTGGQCGIVPYAIAFGRALNKHSNGRSYDLSTYKAQRQPSAINRKLDAHVGRDLHSR